MALVRPVTAADLAVLESAFGIGEYFVRRSADAAAGRCVLLAAWEGPVPVAHGYLWEDSEPESPQHVTAVETVRKHLAGVPLIQGLHVAADRRRRGIGRAMVTAMERSARERGHDRIALGVDPDHAPAVGLYRGLGYRDWAHGTFEVTYRGVSEDGREQWFTEPGVMMVKRL